MSTLTAKILSKLNTTDFNIGILSADNADRAALVKVKPEDIDTLIDNLNQLKTYVADLQEHKQANARKLLESLVAESSEFSTVEELLSVLGKNVETSASAATTATKMNTNKSFEVVLTDSSNNERRTFTITNKVLPKALQNDPVYQAIIAKNKELTDVDLFLRAYSPTYAEQYPINAKFKKETFYLNSKGRLNAQGTKYFEAWKKENPEGDEKSFKEAVTKAYKNV
ncbi:hypothetical protein [Leclercia sp. GLN_9]|uniref:hypothetical protein n=1 Tax=Leclercia sp. GLN_9 TaxID=3367184 RepID=UPI00370B52A8